MDTIRKRLNEYKQAGVGYIALFFPMEDVSVGLKQVKQFAQKVIRQS